MANTLFLRLEGPLQSWGERARWSVRDTSPEPTKSGMVGLLACALGWNDDERIRELSRQIRVGVRCDKPGTLLVDYHTVVGGVMSAEGKIKINQSTKEPETVVSWRYYLCDASFLVAAQGASDLIARLAKAVQEPHWALYLGRKSCPPGCPPFAGVGDYATLELALADPPLISAQPSDTARVRSVIECAPGEGVRRRDQVDSHARRTFLPRYTKDVPLDVRVQAEEV
jgi:CRISPR system Cascade subunit CasD